MIEKWVNFKRDYLEISFLRENCGYDGSDDRRRIIKINILKGRAGVTTLSWCYIHLGRMGPVHVWGWGAGAGGGGGGAWNCIPVLEQRYMSSYKLHRTNPTD